MDEQLETKSVKVIRIGPDQVTINDAEVIIESKREMPDWKVRDSNVPAIYFEDKKYFLAEIRKPQPPYSICYVLMPWREGLSTNTKRFFTYDAETVAERDSARRSEIYHEVGRMCLMPLYPLLGLFWSGVQKWLTRFGFIPRTMTGISIFTVFCLMLAQGVFACVMINASARTGNMMIGGMIRAMSNGDQLHMGSVVIPIVYMDSLLLLACLVDVLMRYSNYLRDYEWSGGFLEWLLPKSLRKK